MSHDPRQALRRGVNFPTMSGYVTKILRSGLGIILSFWIAGAGCMFGCQNMVAFAAGGTETSHESSLATIVSGEACASGGSHDCCAKKKAEAATNTQTAKTQKASNRPSLKLAALLSQAESLKPVPSSGGRECPLALSRAVAVAKKDDNQNLAAPVAVVLATPAQIPTEQHAALSRAARLPNRGHTYLRCCVFLI